MALVLGALLDGIPESAAIGISLLDGGAVGLVPGAAPTVGMTWVSSPSGEPDPEFSPASLWSSKMDRPWSLMWGYLFRCWSGWLAVASAGCSMEMGAPCSPMIADPTPRTQSGPAGFSPVGQ